MCAGPAPALYPPADECAEEMNPLRSCGPGVASALEHARDDPSGVVGSSGATTPLCGTPSALKCVVLKFEGAAVGMALPARFSQGGGAETNLP